jgi:hypothetical protein
MTATIEEAMEALAAAFSDIAGLSTYPLPPGQIEVPAVVVSLPSGELGDYSPVMDAGVMDLNLVVNVFVQWGDDDAAWDQLRPFVSATGAYSLFAAVNADPTLGGVVDSALVGTPTNFGSYTYGAVQYLGAEVPVEVFL